MPGVSDPVRIVDENGLEISPTNPLDVTGAVSGSVTIIGVSDVNLAEVGGVATSLGQKVSASSIPVVLSSDDKPQVNITQVNGTGIAIGQGAMNQSFPVVIASDQTSFPTKDAGPSQTITRTFSSAADGSVAFDISVAPTAGQKILLLDALLSVNTACLLTIQMETSGNVLVGFYMPANSSLQITPRGYLKGDLADKKLQAKTSVASAIRVTAIYTSEA